MANKVKLDDVDRRILKDLQEDGRMTNVELAKRIGISAPPCLRRVRALEDQGVIRGYHGCKRELGVFCHGFCLWVDLSGRK